MGVKFGALISYNRGCKYDECEYVIGTNMVLRTRYQIASEIMYWQLP